MTEVEWLACSKPEAMLKSPHGKTSARKRRLFACACCRRIWHLLGKKTRTAVELAERFADRLASAEELAACHASLTGSQFYLRAVQRTVAPGTMTADRAHTVARACALAAARAAEPRLDANLDPGCYQEFAQQAPLLRDVLGNPFRYVSFDLALRLWNGGAAVALAREMYEARDFGRALLLADMLEDAGCSDPLILKHLRGPGPHVRGCWVVDLLLGKK